MVEHMKSERLSLCLRFSYGVGHFLNDLCASMWFTYLLVFLHLVTNFSNKMAGYLMLLGQVADAISTPFIGHQADSWSRGIFGYGKRKSWHLIGTICVVCSFPFLFNKCLVCSDLCYQGLASCWTQFIYFAPFVIVFQFGWASVQVSHLSLIPELTHNEAERVGLTSVRNAFTLIAGILVYGLAWCLQITNGSVSLSDVTNTTQDIHTQITAHDAPVFSILVITVVGIGLVFQIIFHCGTPEVTNTSFDVTEIQDLMETLHSYEQHIKWKDWLKQPQFYQLGAIYTCTRLVVNVTQVYMAMYLTVGLHLPKEFIAIIPLIIFLSGFIVTLFLQIINSLFGRKVTYLLGALVILCSCLWMWLISIYNAPMYVIGAAILLGLGNSVILVNSLSMTADLIGNQTTSGAFVYGAMSFTDKIVNGLVIMCIQYLHPCQSSFSCPQQSQRFYNTTMVFVPTVFILISLLVLSTLARVNIGKLSRHNQDEDDSDYTALMSHIDSSGT